MSLLRRNRASDELDEAAVAAGKKHLALTAVTCLSSHRSGVMTTPRTRTDSATEMTSFPSVTHRPPEFVPDCSWCQSRSAQSCRYSTSVGWLTSNGQWRLRNALNPLQANEHHQFYSVCIIDCRQRMNVA